MHASERRHSTSRRSAAPEPHREDLLREATALRRRAELAVPDEPEHVVAGFRAAGELSIYFGGDPVYHVDAAGRLRRAFVTGDLYRTQGTTLARLTRVRAHDVTELRRHDLDRGELAEFLHTLRDRLERFRAALRSGSVAVMGQVPAGDNAFLGDLERALERILAADIALAPVIKGKR